MRSLSLLYKLLVPCFLALCFHNLPLMGAMIDDGEWWAYFSPLIGERMPSPMQVPVCESSCCVANGPRGLLITPG